ncbi:MAG: pyridoxal phosphate-dependent aminotransferase [Spirochaetaceae bacterium]|nr:MAG: pyridoxal phosphate-dependent aminotransferase [Spirochaetaceae bacterium]
MGSNPAVLTITCLRRFLRAGFFMVNALLQKASEMRAAGLDILDLSDTSFHRNGLCFPNERLKAYFDEYLARRSYDPDPRGLPAAREAIASCYTSRDIACEASDVLLTASTSDAYNIIFQSLCNAGDRVLLPRPCYPLFEHLCRYARLRMDYYDLDPARGFSPDFDSLNGILRRPAALLVTISPNNPTGSCLSQGDWLRLRELCTARGITMVHDEVFSDLVWDDDARGRGGEASAYTGALLRLSGVSKLFASPDLKLSWIALTEALPEVRTRILDTLETARDMYLNSSGPSEYFAFRMLTDGASYRGELYEQLKARKELADEILMQPHTDAGGAVPYPQQGGVHRVIRLPDGYDDEASAHELLEQDRVLVHPGYMYGFRGGEYWVVSIMSAPHTLRHGLSRVARYLKLT